MKRKLRKLDRQIVIRFEFLDTPGDEVAPGSDEIGKDFENEFFCHKPSVFGQVLRQSDSTVPARVKSKGYHCSVSSN